MVDHHYSHLTNTQRSLRLMSGFGQYGEASQKTLQNFGYKVDETKQTASFHVKWPWGCRSQQMKHKSMVEFEAQCFFSAVQGKGLTDIHDKMIVVRARATNERKADEREKLFDMSFGVSTQGPNLLFGTVNPEHWYCVLRNEKQEHVFRLCSMKPISNSRDLAVIMGQLEAQGKDPWCIEIPYEVLVKAVRDVAEISLNVDDSFEEYRKSLAVFEAIFEKLER